MKLFVFQQISVSFISLHSPRAKSYDVLWTDNITFKLVNVDAVERKAVEFYHHRHVHEGLGVFPVPCVSR